MLMVIDVGNTRTKWAQVAVDDRLGAMRAVLNKDIATAAFKGVLQKADKVMIANVAGEGIAQQIIEMLPKNTEVVFAKVREEACGVVNHYHQDSLGIDRWAAVIAAWHQFKQPIIVVNAGTAVTIDALARDNETRKGTYLGGSIMPGLPLMYRSLAENTAKLPSELTGKLQMFPVNTQDAIYSGCITAIAGSITLQLKQLEKHSAFLPKVAITGGDAIKVASALHSRSKQVHVIEDLVLQGLVLLEKECV